MASIRSRNGLWQARITRQGHPHIAKSFQTRQDAERWARQTETEIDKGSFINLGLAERTLFKDVVERYVQEVTLKTRSMKEDTYRLRALSRHPIAKLRMTALTPIKVAEYRDERLQIVSNGAVIRELSYFSSIINHARREWGITMVNPIPLVKKPASTPGRTRILDEDELTRLFNALKPRVKNANIWILPLAQFALETAMRRGEILGLKWKDIELESQIAYI
jgi:integrase